MITTMNMESQIRICNAINSAVARDQKVMADEIAIAGAFPNIMGVCAIGHNDWNEKGKVPICLIENRTVRAFRKKEIIEEEILYKPPAAETAASKPDLSKPSP